MRINIASKEVIHFGEIGTAAKTKLLSNFLSLGTTTFVIETIKAANYFNIDLQKILNPWDYLSKHFLLSSL